jgi:peptide/nickel transport system substrate-binding protein
MNPLQTVASEGYILSRWLYSNLTQLTPELEVKSDLATEWSANSDASEWTFTLREDATFHHDGSTVTAEDVAATFNRIYAEDSSAAGKGALGPIDIVEATSEFEVTISLTDPYADLPKTLTSQWGRVLPADIAEGDTSRLEEEEFGSGPFVLEEFTVGDSAVVSRYDDYYKTDEEGNSLPYVSRVTMNVLPEATAQVNALQNQEADVLQRVAPAQTQRVQSMQGSTMLERPSGGFYPVVMDTTVEPFDDLRVRQAMKYAVDRQEMLSSASQDLGVLGEDTPVSPVHEFYTEIDDMYGDTADVETAQQLLADAGYGDGITLDIPLQAPSEHAPPIGPTAVVFQEQMQQIGIEFDIQQVTWDSFLSEIETQAPFYVSFYGLRPAEIQILNLLFVEGNTFYGTNWHESSPDVYDEFTSMIDDAASTTDADARQELYTEIMGVVHEHSGIIVPFFESSIGANNNYVRDYQHDPTGFRIPMEDPYLTSDAPEK